MAQLDVSRGRHESAHNAATNGRRGRRGRRLGRTGTMVVERLAFGCVTVLVVSVLVFAATEVLPGNAARAILGQSATPQRIHDLERTLHLNASVITQYRVWLSGVVTGDFGVSFAARVPVWDVIEPRLVNSAVLVVLAGALGTAVGVSAGVYAGVRRGRVFDELASVGALAATALPEFIVASLLILVFATNVWRVLPGVSPIPPGSEPWDHPRLLVLPVTTLVCVIVPYQFRIARAAVIEAMGSEYVEMARLKGLPEWRVAIVHALPNTVPLIVQVAGLNFLYLAGGIVIVEYVFAYPGIGAALVSAVSERDVPVIQCIVLLLATFYVLVNILTDVLALIASPRRRLAS